MGQQLFKSHLELFNSIKIDDTKLKSNLISSEDDGDDINFFVCPKSITESDDHHPVISSKKLFTKRNQDQLFLLTKSITLEEIDTQINELLIKNVFIFIENCYKQTMQQIKDISDNQQRLQISLTNKIQEEKLNNKSIFHNQDKKKENKSQQLSYFAIQSLSSVLLILIKSVEKNDPTIIHQILTLTYELCEQIPMKSLSLTNNSNFLFKSLKPLINYINSLSLSNDPIISKQILRILLSFAIAKASFKDILPLLSRLIFDTVEIYDAQGIFVQLNDGLTEEVSSLSLDYLKSLNVYPNSQLMEIDEQLFTGQFISSIILTHINFDNEIHSNNGSIDSSFSFEFHSETFKQLFEIIEQLSSHQMNSTILHILTICLRLFTTHLKFLCALKSNLDDSMKNFDLIKWFQIISKLACNEEQLIICQEASKALIYIINYQASTFSERLFIMHQYILDNQHPILIKELLIEMNREETIVNWIEVLYESDRKILYSFIDIYFNLSNEIDNEQKQQIQNMLMLFPTNCIISIS